MLLYEVHMLGTLHREKKKENSYGEPTGKGKITVSIAA